MADKIAYLGIDTSNYTTSLAFCTEDGEIGANIRRILEVKAGERGLRQSDAVFGHIKNLPELSRLLDSMLCGYKISAVGVSTSPRDVEDSYMPCFMCGRAVAYSIAATHHVPVFEFSHQSGHIMAALYTCGRMDELLGRDFVAFHVSGGTTEAVYVKSSPIGFDIQILADTADISAGQAIDRVGVMMGLKFPCGKELERLALACREKMHKPKISVVDGRCNLSGLENIAERMYRKSDDAFYVARYVLNFIAETLVRMTEDIRKKYPDIPILYAGGVMSNSIIRERISTFSNVLFASPELSSDNAVGTALLARKKYMERENL